MRAILIVDLQNDFCPGGALPVPEGAAVVPVINRLSRHFDHVLLTQDWHPPGHHSFASAHPGKEPYDTIQFDYGEQILWPDHCVQGSHGAAFHPDLDTRKAELIIRKGFRPEIDSYSAFFENDHQTPTGLAGYLGEREIDTLFVVGLALDFCVHWSAVDGRRLGLNIFVVEEASRAIDTRGSLGHALMQIQTAGARLISADEALEKAHTGT